MVEKDKLNKFVREYNGIWKSLVNWVNIKMKTFSPVEALSCVYEFTNGNHSEMEKVLRQLTAKRKVQGRSQVHNDSKVPEVDIVRDENGNLTVIGYNPDKEEPAKGMKVQRNPKIFKKGDDNQVNKNYKRVADNMGNIGAVIRELNPTAPKPVIELMIDAVRRFAAAKKIGYGSVIAKLKLGKLQFDNHWNITENRTRGNRVIVIDESVLDEIKSDYEMTEFRFNSNVKKFLHDLLVDPINADTSDLMKAHNLDRNTLIKHLRDCGMLRSNQHINDKDENGNPKSATMKVRYAVPKKNFNRNLKRLYIRLFEQNLPINEEEGGAMGGATSADSSGQFSQPLFSKPVKQKPYTEVMDEASTTQTVGNYQYDVPFAGDEETLSRHNGVGGSVSINFADESEKHY